jgi:DNA-binding winged helix-turn-helix (wHTH) protein
LTRCISELRRALGDDVREPHVIETVPRSGYRLIAFVDSIASQVWPVKIAVLPFEQLGGDPERT